MNDVSERLFTAKSLLSQAAHLMLGNILTVLRLSVGFIVTLAICFAALLAIWVKYTPYFPRDFIYLSPIVLTATVVVIGAITLVRLYRFAALGSHVERFVLAELFSKRTWRFVWVNFLIILQLIVLGMLLAFPVAIIIAAMHGGLSGMTHGLMNSALTEVLRSVMYMFATMVMAVRYMLSSPAASMRDRVSFEALSTAGKPYRKDLILVVLLLVGAPTALSAAQTFMEAAQIGPAWIVGPWIEIILLLYWLSSYLVFIGACSLAYKALRSDVERETEAVLSRKAYPEAAAAAAAQGGADAASGASGPSPDAARDVSASGAQGVSDSKA